MQNYKIVSKIGQGHYGVVKLAKEKGTGRKVAIKILDKNKMNTKEGKSRLLLEKEIIKSFDHLNVIKIFDIDEDPKKIYIIMEYCDKGELRKYIEKKKKIR